MDTVVGTVDADGWSRMLVGVCVTSKQNGARRTVPTQTEPSGISDCVYVSQFGECYHRDRKCHGLRNASRVNERASVSKSVVGQKHRITQPKIVESHRGVSQAVLVHEDSQGFSFTDRCQHASGWELGSHIAMT